MFQNENEIADKMHEMFSQRFLFEETDIRGELVTLDKSYQEILQQHYYPNTVVNLLFLRLFN